jgi:hypothetical protein
MPAILDIIGALFVTIGLLLTFDFLNKRIVSGRTIGWALAAVGMFLFFIHSVLLGKIISSILSLLFTLINTYFSVNYYKEERR